MDGDYNKTPIEISKQLEIVNFKAFLLKYPPLKTTKDDLDTVITKKKAKRWSLKNNKVSAESNKVKKMNEPKTQLVAFQQAMKPLFTIGQSFGLNPVRGISEIDIGKIRFIICYWRFLHCIIIGIVQVLALALCLYRLIVGSITIGALGFFAFYATTCSTTFLFIQIGSKWAKLMNDISKCSLDEYINPRIKAKCYTASVVVMSLAIIEHLLSILYKVVHTFDCHPDVYFYDEFLKEQFPWFFNLNVPRYIPLGIVLQIINTSSTVIWNYSDLYIVCISMYLTSILELINVKIISASEKHYLPSSYWRTLREEYNRATQLVRSFDDVFSGMIFTSFASNLFFVCLQLFNILAHGVSSKVTAKHICTEKSYGPFAGYEYTIYLIFSVTYLFVRSVYVSLVAASVNTASLVPAQALYSVPSSAFCDEVSRFIAQVNGDNIALSGLQFFYVTRHLALSVAGTIITYELVLLQFSNEEIDGKD